MQAVRQMRQLQDTSEHVMSSHYSSMHIHGAHIVIVGPGAAHNFHEKAKISKNPSWTDIATVVCTRGLRTSGKVRVEYDDETILQVARIRPDVCSEGGDGGVGRGLGMPADGEEDKDDPSSKRSAHVAKAEQMVRARGQSGD